MDISSFFKPAEAAEKPAEAAAAERPYSQKAHEVRERYRVDLDEAIRQLKAAQAELDADSSLGKEHFKSKYDKLRIKTRGNRWQLKLGESFPATAKSAVNAPISGLHAQYNCNERPDDIIILFYFAENWKSRGGPERPDDIITLLSLY